MFSASYLKLLREFEGYFARPYVCPAGYCTIGYGTNLEAHPRFIDDAQAREMAQSKSLRGAKLCKCLTDLGMVWNREKAEEAMVWELERVHTQLQAACMAYVKLRAKTNDPAAQVRADALLDMGYNMGVGRASNPSKGIRGSGLLGFSTTLPMIERGEYAAAAENLTKSKWYRQVGRRSKAVCFMIKTGTYPEKL